MLRLVRKKAMPRQPISRMRASSFRELRLDARRHRLRKDLVALGLEMHVVWSADLFLHRKHDGVEIVDGHAKLLHDLDGQRIARGNAVELSRWRELTPFGDRRRGGEDQP